MNLTATAADKRVVIDGAVAFLAPGGWPPEVVKVEWFGNFNAGVISFADGSAERFTDETVLVPLVLAWRVARARQLRKPGAMERILAWLRRPRAA